MSFQALRLVYAAPASTATDQCVLVVVAWHAGQQPVADEHGRLAYEAWPSVETIAREAGLSRRESARLALRRLEKDGRLERIASPGRRANRYRIPLPTSPRGVDVQDGATSPRDRDHAKRGGSDATSPRGARQPPREPGRELTVNGAYASSSDLDTRARASGAEGEGDPMADLSEDAKRRVRAALVVLAERAMANDPDLKRLEARSAQLVYLRRLTELAAKHDHLTPEELASWVDYARATDDG